MNGKIIKLVWFGDIGKAYQGIKTGQNDYYLYQNPEARGSYKDINQYKKFLLTDEEIEIISTNEELRLKVINRGLHKSRNEANFDPDLWFDGKYIVPLDKGGESDSGSGWLPNYYVPTNYFIDWSCEAINRMKTLTIGQRDGTKKSRICSRFQNVKKSFSLGITFSPTGIYAPTFRTGVSAIFESKGSTILLFNNLIRINELLGLFNSKAIKYIMKNVISHSVEFGEESITEIPIIIGTTNEFNSIVKKLIANQKQNPRYDYMSNEQKEIDKLVYEMYGLNDNDIKEVETWYARRYPKLARFAEID